MRTRKPGIDHLEQNVIILKRRGAEGGGEVSKTRISRWLSATSGFFFSSPLLLLFFFFCSFQGHVSGTIVERKMARASSFAKRSRDTIPAIAIVSVDKRGDPSGIENAFARTRWMNLVDFILFKYFSIRS